MTTKDDFLFLKRSHVTHNNSYIDHNAREFSNLNLNQTLKNSYVQPVQLHSKTNIETQFDYNGKEKLQLSDKSFTDNFCSKISNPLTHKDEVKMKSKKRWKKDNSFSSNTNSTLSLHIAAYENSVEVITNPLIENENLNRKKEKPDLIKKWKNADKIIVGSTPAIQISYEFPRQQEENCITDPEVMQFKASQQLLNSNQSITSFQQVRMLPKEKHIRMELSRIKDFVNPKGDREQYMTSIEVAIKWLNLVYTEIGIEEKVVADLGCGTGMLSCAALAYGAKQAYGFELDANALEQATESIDDEDSFVPVNVDIEQLDPEAYPKFDIVLSNPPFGTKEKPHIDFAFIEKGCKLLSPGGVLYTLHKTSCVDAVIKKGVSQISGVSATKDAKINWELLNTYKHHKKKSVDIDVTLVSWRFSST